MAKQDNKKKESDVEVLEHMLGLLKELDQARKQFELRADGIAKDFDRTMQSAQKVFALNKKILEKEERETAERITALTNKYLAA